MCSDQPLLESQDVVFAAFARLPKLAKGSVGREELTAFIDTYFGKAGRYFRDSIGHTDLDECAAITAVWWIEGGGKFLDGGLTLGLKVVIFQ